MNVKKESRSALWKMFFAFLVISKSVYYFDIIAAALYQGGLWAMGEAVLNRLLTQDILIILIILLTFNTEKLVAPKILKYNKTVNQIIVHIIDYILYIGAIFIYFLIMNFFSILNHTNWRGNLIGFSILYLVIVIVIETKKCLKKKEMTEYTSILNADEKLAMLKALLDNSVLTQEEYDRKKEKLLGV